MTEPTLDPHDPSLTPDEWARQTAARLRRGRERIDEKALRDELLDVWRAAVVADQGLDELPRPPLPGRLVDRTQPRQRPRECPPGVTHLTSGRGSLAVHVRADPERWAWLPTRSSAAGPTPGAALEEWAASTADRICQGNAASEHRAFLRARLIVLARDASRSRAPGTRSLVDLADVRLAWVELSIQPSAGSDDARRRAHRPPATAPGLAEIDYYAHRELGPANRVLHFCPPGLVEFGPSPSGSLTLVWPLDAASDLLVVLRTRCASRLLNVLPAVDALVETLEICPASTARAEPEAPAHADDEPFPGRSLHLLDAETQARYQVFAENFVRGLGRLPAALEAYRPILEGAFEASDVQIDQLRADMARPDGALGETPLLLLHAHDSESDEDRIHPLTYCTVGGSFGVFAFRSGSRTPPVWYEELLANPAAVVEVGDRTIEVMARVLDGARREAIWEEQKARYPGLAEYETSTRPVIPVVMLDRR